MKKVMKVIALIIACGQVFANTDSVKVSLNELEDTFLKQNALLLATKYDIEASKARIIQAKLWDNPTLSFEQMAFNNQTNKLLPLLGLSDQKGKSPTTQQAVQIQQLFRLAKKRFKETTLAQTAAEMAEISYYDLLRGLKYEIRANFYDLYFLQKALTIYNDEISSIAKTLDGMNLMYQKGVIPLKDITRMKALEFSLQTEKNAIISQMIDKQGNLRILIGTKNEIYFVPSVQANSNYNVDTSKLSLANLLNSALENRPDYKLQKIALNYEEQNLDLQKALKTPDLRAGMLYDRAGSSVPNYFAFNMQIDLPFFNKNQGNIKTAEYRIKSQEKHIEGQEQKIITDVQVAYKRLFEIDNLNKKYDKTLIENFDKLLESVKTNYTKQIISMLEFIDFYESYKNSALQMNQLQNNHINAIEELNFAIGKEEIKYFKD